MTPEQEDLADRVRELLADASSRREVAMFGGLSFMVDDVMVVAAGRDGSLLVRADPSRHEELTARTGAEQAEMGTGRSMGPSWIRVDRAALADHDRLATWVDVAMAWHAAQAG